MQTLEQITSISRTNFLGLPLNMEFPSMYDWNSLDYRLSNDLFNPFFPVGGGNGIGVNIPLPEVPQINDYHETFNIDRYGNIYDSPYGGGIGNGHSTIVPDIGKEIHIPHQKLPY